MQSASGPAGLRYWMPKPYLLVATAGNVTPSAPTINTNVNKGPVRSLPGVVRRSPSPPVSAAAPAAAQNGALADRGLGGVAGGAPDAVNPSRPPPAPAAGGPGGTGGKSTPAQTSGSTKGTGDDPTGAAAPAAVADDSFSVTLGGYSLKLVWLPDYAHPMSATMSTGLFGTASLSMSLTNGWMLTSINGSGDNKVAETLTALASFTSAIAGGVTGAGAAKSAAPKAGGPAAAPSVAPADPLRPGLYEFVHDEQSGALIGICAVTYFTGNGPVAALAQDCPVTRLPTPPASAPLPSKSS